MANWEKLNKEFDDALDSMTSEDWELFASKRIKQTTITMKTAVEWLESEILEHYSPFDNKLLYEAIHKAKEIEKEQIVNAHYQGYRPSIGTTEISEKYFNETFKQQEQ
jgi:hypothetical protein